MGISVIPSLARNVPYENIDKVIAGWKMSNDDAANLRFVADWLKETEFNGPQPLHVAQGAIAVHNIPKKWILDYYEAIRDPDGVTEVIKTWTVPTFPLNGNDLIAAGVKPGKAIGDILKMARVAWACGHFDFAPEVEAFEANKEQLLRICSKMIESAKA
jgi:hypothetical protein